MIIKISLYLLKILVFQTLFRQLLVGNSQKMHFYLFISENSPNQYEYNLLKKTWVSVKFLYMNWSNITWAIRQKCKSQNVCYKKTKYAKYSKHFLPPDMHLHVCVSGVKKCLFFIKFGVLCFLVTLILRFFLIANFSFLVIPSMMGAGKEFAS